MGREAGENCQAALIFFRECIGKAALLENGTALAQIRAIDLPME
jgi:hypothetical protein